MVVDDEQEPEFPVEEAAEEEDLEIHRPEETEEEASEEHGL